MPIALLVALAGSLAIHAAALFGTDLAPFGEESEPPPLQAELKVPAAPPSPPKPAVKRPKPPAKAASKSQFEHAAEQVPAPAAAAAEPTAAENAPIAPSTAAVPVQPAAKPVLAATGAIRYAIRKESLGLTIGRAEHRWEFNEDGSYTLTGVTETTGLAGLIKPLRHEVISRGHMAPGGLQPETFRTLKNGKDTTENADFDWSTAEVRLARDGSVRSIAPGTQDLLSLNYQLAFFARPENGSSIGVVTGKKYERYELDSLGEEEIDTPAGHFRTLHLRAMTDNITEIWIALDRQRLPVKIRFTDKKGDSFEQVATEIGSP